MKDPENFTTGNRDDKEILKSENSAASDEEAKAQERTPIPRWYGVSYQNDGQGALSPEVMPLDGNVEKKRKRRTRVAVLSAVLVLCMIISSFSGVGAYFLMEYLQSDVEDAGGNLTLGNTNGDLNDMSASSYENTDKGYDYAAAFNGIVKRNDEALLASENGSAGAEKTDMIRATAAVKDSVVEITTTVISNRGSSVVAGAGSGVIIHADGIVITNHHVIENCDQIYVRLTNGDTYEAVLRGSDEDGDIAILKITPQEGKPLTVAKLGYSKALAPGEEVIAIGNPLGELGGTVTNGIISATEREINMDGVTMKLLQTNAAINSGNSGGGLFNLAGELIGIVNAKYAASGVEGLGFAIPIDVAYEKSVKDILQYGYVRGVPSLGIALVEKTGGSFFNTVYAACVYNADANTSFVQGDYIYSVDGTVVYGISTSPLDAIRSILRGHQVGDSVQVVVRRGDEQLTITVVLQEYVPESIAKIQG
ncbi:MAG: trypsin-like serine protease [Ruminococcaceae bacterium]|nr:trypsin-like serine protease [Oscillospiraceae bacterium]